MLSLRRQIVFNTKLSQRLLKGEEREQKKFGLHYYTGSQDEVTNSCTIRIEKGLLYFKKRKCDKRHTHKRLKNQKPANPRFFQ